VLIVERDELIAATLAGALADEGIDAGVATDDEALALTHAASPHVVITGTNRTHREDLAGQDVFALYAGNGPPCASSIWRLCGPHGCSGRPLPRGSGSSPSRFR
jgi:hypothetical protein